MSDYGTSSDDDQRDEDYDDKYVNRKLKESGSKRHSSKEDSTSENGNDGRYNPNVQLLPAMRIPMDTSKSPEEMDFLLRFNTFMTERAYAYPKLVWNLRDGKLPFFIKYSLI